MTNTPLSGCCNSCNEPITYRQKYVLFEGPNLCFPEFGDGTAVFHLRDSCRWDARSYDQAWVQAAPGRTQKIPGWPAAEALLVLKEYAEDLDPAARVPSVLVTLHLAGGTFDGTRWATPIPWDCREVLYTEPVAQPRRAERGVWYEHAAECPCGMDASGVMTPGDHMFRAKLDIT